MSTKRKSSTSTASNSFSSSSSSSSSSSTSSPGPSPSSLNFLKVDAHNVGNKQKRSELFARIRTEKKKLKSKLRRKREKEDENDDEEEAKQKAEQRAKRQKTLDKSREADESMVVSEEEDVELAGEEAQDEFAQYFRSDVTPRICITTSYDCSKHAYEFVQDLLHTIPNSFFYSRRNFAVKLIADEAVAEGYTDLIILKEDHKELNGLTHVHLPNGPTAHYKLSSLRLSKHIGGHAAMTSHRPEVLLNNFHTRLGKRVARMLSALFHAAPSFQGRRALTFHNSRDFIFVRQHRYVFEGKQKVRLQEMGPRFTLKLEWMQSGIFDPQQGQYEWKHQKDMDTSRKRFFL